MLANRELTKQAEVQTRLNQEIGRGEQSDQRRRARSSTRRSPRSMRRRTSTSARSTPRGTCWSRSAEANGTEQVNRALEGSGSAKLLKLRRGLALLNGIEGRKTNEKTTNLRKSGRSRKNIDLQAWPMRKIDDMKRFQILLCGPRPRRPAARRWTPHSTEATEVGVKFNKLTRGLDVVGAGSELFVPADRQRLAEVRYLAAQPDDDRQRRVRRSQGEGRPAFQDPRRQRHRHRHHRALADRSRSQQAGRPVAEGGGEHRRGAGELGAPDGAGLRPRRPRAGKNGGFLRPDPALRRRQRRGGRRSATISAPTG